MADFFFRLLLFFYISNILIQIDRVLRDSLQNKPITRVVTKNCLFNNQNNKYRTFSIGINFNCQ